MFTEILFSIDANCKVPPAVITSTNSARAAMLSLAVRGNVACECTVGGATGYVHAVRLPWDSRLSLSPDFCWVTLPICWHVMSSGCKLSQEAVMG